MAECFAPPRVVIATNDAQGKSVLASDTTKPLFSPFGPQATQFTTLYTTSATPADNSAPLPPVLTSSIPRPPPNGTIFCTSDVPPNSTSAFHRTRTLDYMVVMKGEVYMRLDDGQEVRVGEGEFVVQRGGVHAWVNRSEEWCRMLFVMVDAEPVVLADGKVLEDVFVPHKSS